MDNTEIARILYDIADILEMQDVDWKPQAYRKAAQEIEGLSTNLQNIYRAGKLKDIPGVGEHIAKKIEELIKTGKLRYYEKLKKRAPVNLDELRRVEGLGPKTIIKLYKTLGVTDLKTLKQTAKEGKIKNIPGMGKKSEHNILESIEFAEKSGKRFARGLVINYVTELENKIKQEKNIKKILTAGSYRRKQETIGDLDILITSDKPEETMDYITKLEEVKKIISQGPTRARVILTNRIPVDFRVVKDENFGSAAQYFTGNKEHNIETRKIAIQKGMKLSEYGLFKGSEKIAGKTEEEIYRILTKKYIEPELRQNKGEIIAAKNNKLPKLIKQVKGDLQMHTDYSDGNNTVQEMAEEAKRIGHKYIGITDHAGILKIAGAINLKEIKQQKKDIEKIDFKIFQGAEVDIDLKGKLTIPEEHLKELDYVVASIHTGLRRNEKEQTQRIINAMENEHVKIIAHPTGRIINERKGYNLNWEKIFEKSKETNTYLEINSYPTRIDITDEIAKKAKEYGCKLVINTDAHDKSHLKYIQLGIDCARRAWCEDKDIINTSDYSKIRKLLKK